MSAPRLTEAERDAIRVARSALRDMSHGWSIGELQASPEIICANLSHLLRESYDFASGEVTDKKVRA